MLQTKVDALRGKLIMIELSLHTCSGQYVMTQSRKRDEFRVWVKFPEGRTLIFGDTNISF